MVLMDRIFREQAALTSCKLLFRSSFGGTEGNHEDCQDIRYFDTDAK